MWKKRLYRDFLSGPGLATDHEITNFISIEPLAIVAATSAGDPSAIATLQRYIDRLARTIASVINILDPDMIVLGGGLSNITGLYNTVPALWQSWIFSDNFTTRLLKNHHGYSGGVRGEAWI